MSADTERRAGGGKAAAALAQMSEVLDRIVRSAIIEASKPKMTSIEERRFKPRPSNEQVNACCLKCSLFSFSWAHQHTWSHTSALNYTVTGRTQATA